MSKTTMNQFNELRHPPALVVHVEEAISTIEGKGEMHASESFYSEKTAIREHTVGLVSLTTAFQMLLMAV